MLRLFLFTISGQVAVVRAAGVSEAVAIVNAEFPRARTPATEAAASELDPHGEPGIILDFLG